MANLKIQGITPAAGKIKVGSSDVSKIYKGSTVVWPTATLTYTNQTVWYAWSSNTRNEDIQDVIFNVDATCRINRFYNAQGGDYASVSITGDTLKYLTADTFTVGTAVLTASGTQFNAGYYLITEESATAPAISNAALDPDPVTAPTPDTYKLIKIDSSGNIAQITQYNTLDCQTQSLGFQIRYKGSPTSQLNYGSISPSTSENLVCEINSWIETLGNYTLNEGGSSGTSGKFLAGTSFEVGTTLYQFDGIDKYPAGTYLTKAISPTAGGAPLSISILDPNKPSIPVPDSYQIVIIGANGVITSIDQYNTVTCP